MPTGRTLSSAAKDVIFRAAGLEEEDMRRVVIDLARFKDKEIFVRVVNEHAGH